MSVTEGFDRGLMKFQKTPSVFGYAESTVSLRLGHATALTVRRTVIHSRDAASLPSVEATKSDEISINSPTFKTQTQQKHFLIERI